MLDKVNEEINRFWNEKGIMPNALILGIEVVNELMESYDLIVEVSTEVKYVCGFPLLSIDYCDTKIIRPILI